MTQIVISCEPNLETVAVDLISSLQRGGDIVVCANRDLQLDNDWQRAMGTAIKNAQLLVLIGKAEWLRHDPIQTYLIGLASGHNCQTRLLTDYPAECQWLVENVDNVTAESFKGIAEYGVGENSRANRALALTG